MEVRNGDIAGWPGIQSKSGYRMRKIKRHDARAKSGRAKGQPRKKLLRISAHVGSPSPAEPKEIITMPDFAVLRHSAMNDDRLSAEALGLLDCVWSRPDEVIRPHQLAARLGFGRDQIDRYLKELIDTGYVIRRQNGAIESAD